jgi:hypothetical protein
VPFALTLVIAIVLIAVGSYLTFTVGSTVATYSTSSANSINSILIVGINTITLSLSANTTWITPTTPLTLTLGGDKVETYGTNLVHAAPGAYQTKSYTIYAASCTLASHTGDFYNITSVTLSGVPHGFYPGTIATVTESYAGASFAQVPWSSNTANTLTAVGYYTVTPTIATTIAGNGTSALSSISTWFTILGIVFIAAVVIGLLLYAFGGHKGAGAY